jgi:hypothetical protein
MLMLAASVALNPYASNIARYNQVYAQARGRSWC